MMTNKEFVQKLLDVADNYKTLYVMGCFGAPMTAPNKKRYIAAWEYNRRSERAQMINAATTDTFGFDCVNLIKALLWGWSGNKTSNYGGAKYASNGVPDVGANAMITQCLDVKTSDWENIIPGEAVWLSGHIGIYVGDGLVVECSPRWENSVQKTALLNVSAVAGYNGRVWTRHGKLPWIQYVVEDMKQDDFQIGDIVQFAGGEHYSNSLADKGFSVEAGEAKITAIAKNAKHPIHIIRTPNSSSKVYGWVDKNKITKRG